MKMKILVDSPLQLLALKDNVSLLFISDDPWAINVIYPHNWEDIALIDCLKRKDMFSAFCTQESLLCVSGHHIEGQEGVGLDRLPTCALVFSHIAKKKYYFLSIGTR